MADNVTVRLLGGSAAAIATDEVGGAHVQRVKLQHGADGAAADASSASPLPVVQSGGSLSPGDSDSNDARGVVVARGQVWDGVASTWGRNAWSGIALTTAERSSTTSSPLITAPQGSYSCLVVGLRASGTFDAGVELTLTIRGTYVPIATGYTDLAASGPMTIPTLHWLFWGTPLGATGYSSPNFAVGSRVTVPPVSFIAQVTHGGSAGTARYGVFFRYF